MTIEMILVVAIVSFGLGFLFGRLANSANKSRKSPPSVPIAVQKPSPLPADVKERVQALVGNGHKIGALKELRDSTEVELDEAKSIVDSMVPSTTPADNADKIGIVRDLLRSGNKDEALKLYRESSGMTLKKAEEAIDKMEKEFG